ncbi:radical SAM protein [bacterium]|nr:radical SAM protein [bacterium]
MYNVIILAGQNNPRGSNVGIPLQGPASCANALRANGISCLVVNHLPYYDIDEMNELLDHAVSNETLLIGISTTFLRPSIQGQLEHTVFQYNLNNSILDKYNLWEKSFDQSVLFRLKNKFPKLKFIIGGADVHPDQEYPLLDFMCIGFSEISVVNVAKNLLHGTSIPNSYKTVFGTTIVDDREAKSYNFANSYMHWLPEDVVTHKKLTIEIGRGCIFNCAFCSYPMRGKDNLDHVKNGSSLITELKHNYENYGITNYVIVDDTFNDSKEKLENLRDAIKTLDFQPTFWCYARLDLIATKIDTLDLLYEIGIRSMFFGLESFTRKTGLAVGKGFSSSKLISTINFIKNKYPDIRLFGNFIVGLPYESIEEVTETARMLRDGEIHLDSWNFTRLVIKNLNTNRLWPSSLDKDWQKYGYRKLTEAEGSEIMWENDHMNIHIANQLFQEFNSSKWGQPALQGQTHWFDENEHKSTFLPKYKQQLLDIVRSKNT